MKKLKKLVSILLAAILVLGVAATGFAAAPEQMVLEEVAASSAVAPEVDAPVVEEAPVAEAAAIDEPVANAAAAVEETITYTAISNDAVGQPLPFAKIELTITENAVVDVTANGNPTVKLGKTASGQVVDKVVVNTDKNGKVDVKYLVTTPATTSASVINAKVLADDGKGTSKLIYAAGSTAAVSATIAETGDGDVIAPEATQLFKSGSTVENTRYNGTITITGTVKDAANKAVDNLDMAVTPPAGNPVVTKTDDNGKFTASFTGANNFLGTYRIEVDPSGGYIVTSGDTVDVKTTTTGTETVAVEVAEVNTVTVLDSATNNPISGIKVEAVGDAGDKKSDTTDADGKIVFDKIVFGSFNNGEEYSFTSGGKSVTTGLHYFYDYSQTATGDANGNIKPVEILLEQAPALSAMEVKLPSNYLAVIGQDEELTPTFGAAGFPDLADEAAMFDFTWQYKSGTVWNTIVDGQTINGSVHYLSGVNGETLEIDTVTAALNNKQYRVVVAPADAGYTQKEAESTVACISNVTFTTSDGRAVNGTVYNSRTAQKIGNLTAAAKVNVWNAADYEADNNATPLKTVGMAGGDISVTLPAGNYVMGFKSSASKTDYTSLAAGATPFNTYGGIVKFTVKETGNTNPALFLDPTPAVVITQDPQDRLVTVGDNAIFKTTAYDCTGAKAVETGLTYQWQMDRNTGGFENIPGATTAELLIGNVTKTMNNYKVRVVVADSAATGSVVSKEAVLKIGTASPVGIVNHPQSVSVAKATKAEFKVGIAGTAEASYKWQVDTGKGFTDITTGGMYTVAPIVADLEKDMLRGQKLTINANYVTDAINNYKYRVVVKDEQSDKEYTSAAATLSVVAATPLSIVKQPESTTAPLNGMMKFNVVAEGTGDFSASSYQWQVSTDKGLNFTNITPSEVIFPEVDGEINYKDCTAVIPVTSSNMKGYVYRVIVTLDESKQPSSHATLTDIIAVIAPAISAHPQDQTVALNRKATFEFAATGTGLFKYAKQESTDGGKTWKPSDSTLKGTPLTDGTVWKTDASFDVRPTSITENGKKYKFAVRQWASVASAGVTVFTNPAILTVTEVEKLSIIKQPAPSVVGVVGGTVTLDVEAGGSAPFGYIWEKSDNGYIWEVVGASKSYTTSALTAEDNQTQYRVRITNKEGDYVVSNTSMLTVSAVPAEMVIKGVDSVYVGKTADYTIGIKPADAVYDVVWSISESNAKKASIDAGGKLTAKAQGIIKVYAKVTTADGKVTTLSQKVSIKSATKSFILKSKEDISVLYKGAGGKKAWHTQLVLSEVLPMGASSSVKDMNWRSSNPNIATVVNGKVKVAKGDDSEVGTVTITATDKGNSKSIATYVITVTKAD